MSARKTGRYADPTGAAVERRAGNPPRRLPWLLLDDLSTAYARRDRHGVRLLNAALRRSATT